MLIKSVIQAEAERNAQMIREYEALLQELPKGSLICRKNEYYYLKYRDGGKVVDKYIGKNAETISSLKDQLSLRRHYSEMLAALRKEQTTIHKLMEGLE